MAPPQYKLYVPSGSFRAFAPLIAAAYNDISIEVVTEEEDGVVLAEILKEKSPTGKGPLLEVIPAADTNQNNHPIVIFSPMAMARHVASLRRDTGLLGASCLEEAVVESWMEWTVQSIEMPAMVLWYPVAGYMTVNEQATKKAMEDMKAALTILEQTLQHNNNNKSSYLVGNNNCITLADIVAVSTLVYPFQYVRFPLQEEFPNVLAWFQHCVELSEFQSVLGKSIVIGSKIKK